MVHVSNSPTREFPVHTDSNSYNTNEWLISFKSNITKNLSHRLDCHGYDPDVLFEVF